MSCTGGPSVPFGVGLGSVEDRFAIGLELVRVLGQLGIGVGSVWGIGISRKS